jgi:hypothetical protein
MSRDKRYIVWAWLKDGEPVYVGWGKYMPEGLDEFAAHPAARLFELRLVCDSPLNAWLRTLESEPTRDPNVERLGFFHKADARNVCLAKREDLIRKGFEQLASRDADTYKGGGGPRKVYNAETKFAYVSVAAAARAAGVNTSTMTRWCQTQNKVWRYHEELVTHEQSET